MKTMPVAETLPAYAELAVKVGLNLQPGQSLFIRTMGQVESVAPLVREVTTAAYKAGANLVDVFWSDEALLQSRLKYAPATSMEMSDKWRFQVLAEQSAAGAAMLSIRSSDPEYLNGYDRDRIEALRVQAAQDSAEFYRLVSQMAMNWCGMAAASPGWARKIFPDLPVSEAVDRLWQAIFASCRLDQLDPIKSWHQHHRQLTARKAYLNKKQYQSLHYRAPGTDLKVGLAHNHLWLGGATQTPSGIDFTPNLPTEEIFTTPHRRQADGVVANTMPLVVQGQVIKGLRFYFENGQVVKHEADEGADIIGRLLDTDEGARRLGEVALVPHSSPISRSGVLFYNTLFDENAANHLAIGRAYAIGIENGATMSANELAAAGGNHSLIHIDFMIGSNNMDIDGISADGQAEPIMRQGEWAFAIDFT